MADIYPAWVLQLRTRALNFFNRHSVPRWLVFLADLGVVFVAFLIAYFLRFNFVIPEDRIGIFVWQGLVATAVYAIFAVIFKS